MSLKLSNLSRISSGFEEPTLSWTDEYVKPDRISTISNGKDEAQWTDDYVKWINVKMDKQCKVSMGIDEPKPKWTGDYIKWTDVNTAKECTMSTGLDEPMLKWADDVRFSIDDDLISISSEQESASDYDGESRARVKPAQEIWGDDYIWSQLQSLPDADKLIALIDADEPDIDEILKRECAYSTGILLATWLGKENILAALLQRGASVSSEDEEGRTALHLAASKGNVACMKLLIEHGAPIQLWDKKKIATPLHCAASKGHLSCLRLLIKHGADVNAGLTSCKTALHYAVQSLAVESVKELLDNNATPNTPQVFSETPLHVAAALGSDQIIKLLLRHGAAVNVQCGPQKLTPLHLTAEDGCSECTRLLINAGASLNATNTKKQTPLHLAALSQCSETIELLLVKGANPKATDVDGRTPLHCAIAKVSRSGECVRVLLSYGANVNTPDAFGYTPLHLAALNEFPQLVMLLINNGGDVTLRTNGGVSVLTFITRKTPEVIPKYLKKFDSSIRLTDHEIGDVDCELKLDFRPLVPTRGNRETDLLLNFIEVGHRQILKHPLCETFMYLKWKRIRKFFFFSFVYHKIFVLLFSIYIYGVFLKNCPSMRSQEFKTCRVSDFYKTIGYILVVFNITLLLKEIYQMAQSWYTYLKLWENWLQLLIIMTVFGCVQPMPQMDIQRNVDTWQHHVAAIGIFLAWVELMLIVGRFPIFGLYVQMFTRVSYNFTKFVMAYICLLIAFALSFGVIFANYPSFKDLKWTILKVIVMMSGELEFEDIFYDKDYPIIYSYTAHFMFLAFVVLVAVVLTNLMVGLAVNDIQGLQQSAGLDRLVRQVELVAHLEGMLFSRLLSWIPKKLTNFLHKQALLLSSQFHWALYIRPNDPREERIPKYLIKSIYRLVSERKERPKSKKRHSRYKSESETISPALSRLNSYTSMNYRTDSNYKHQTSIKLQLLEINHEFLEFSKAFRHKLERLNSQLGSAKQEGQLDL